MGVRGPCPSDVPDDAWALVAPWLTLLAEDAGPRRHGLREAVNGPRHIPRTGAPWRRMPDDPPPWAAVYQQAQRWPAAGCFEALADDLRAVPRLAARRGAEPSAAIPGSRTLRSTPGSGGRAGYDGARRKRGSKRHLAVDTPGRRLALHVSEASADDRAEVGRLSEAVRDATGDGVGLACVDQGHTGDRAATAAEAHGIESEVVKLPDARKGFVLPPRRWVVERSFARTTRCRRPVKDYERHASTPAGHAPRRLRLPHAQQGRATGRRFVTASGGGTASPGSGPDLAASPGERRMVATSAARHASIASSRDSSSKIARDDPSWHEQRGAAAFQAGRSAQADDNGRPRC